MRQQRVYRTEAVILRELDYAEADRILTLLTPGGKLSAIAKGVRRITSRRAGHLGLFSHVQLVLARGRNLDIVSQAESIETYEGLRSDLLRFTYACYAAELAERFAQEEEENAPLFRLMVEGLASLANEADPRLWMRYFELRLLALEGYQPELHYCVLCHREIAPERNGWSLEFGGLVCPACSAQLDAVRELSLAAQKVLRYLATRTPAEVRSLRLRPETHDEVELVLQHYLEYTLERELKSVAFLKQLRAELRQAEARRASLAPDNAMPSAAVQSDSMPS